MPDPIPNPAAANIISPPVYLPADQNSDVSQAPAGMGGPQTPAASGMGGAPQQPQQTPQPPSPQAAQLARNVKTGLGFHALLGSHVEYQQGPNGPVPVPIQDKPGQLFRSILAGAIMGGAAGANGPNPGGAGYAGFGRGAQAVQANQQEQQQNAQKQAQQQFENQQKANAANTEDQVRKAQIAQANAETLRTNLMTQGASFELHQKVADADKDRISTFANAGVKPTFEDIPESQLQDIIKNSPGASTLDWRHTGVKTTIGPDGNPSYEYTLSAYDPRASAPLSAATVKQWGEDGLFKYHPEYKDIAKEGKTLSVDQFTALDKQAQNLSNQNLAKTKNDLEVNHLKAQIDEAKAATAAHWASTRNENLSANEKTQALKDKKEQDDAWDSLAKVGNDPDKLTDPHQRAVIARAVLPLMQETLTGIKTAASEAQGGDKDAQAQLPDLWAKYNTYSKLASLAPQNQKPPVTVTTSDGKVGQIPADKLDDFLKANPGATVAGKTPPAAPTQAQPVTAHTPPAQVIQAGIQNAPPPTPNTAAVSF